MKFGVMFANTGFAATPEGAAALGSIAEGLGYESLWTVEHVVVPADYQSTYPYSPTGRMPGTEDSPIPDPLVWLTYVGALTKTIKLATGILILPQRNPVVLSKELATLDLFTGGRLVLGVGVGWLREEFDVIGVPFDERGPITDEYVGALRALWSTDETFHGAHANFDRAKMYPKPAQADGVPIVVGGHTKAAARRAGRLGDGFFPGRGALDDLVPLFDEAKRAAKEAGRDPDALELTVGAFDLETAKKLEDLGVTRLITAGFAFNAEQYKQQLGAYADNVMSKFS